MLNRDMTKNAQWLIKMHLKEQGLENLTAVDCTVGKGFDLAFLCQLEEVSKVYGFDIQEEALKISKERTLGCTKPLRLIKDSHHRVDCYIAEKIDIAMFNLGYLPQGDEEIVTQTETTLEAIEKVFSLLAPNGIMTIMTYPGHEEGMREHEAIKKYLSEIYQKGCEVLQISKKNVKSKCPNIFIVLV